MMDFPIGAKEIPANLKCCKPKGIPRIVMQRPIPKNKWTSANHQPQNTNHKILPMTPRAPVPMSAPLTCSRSTTREPKGQRFKRPMLKAARAQGMPTIEITIIRAEVNQESAVVQPPKKSHRRFNSKFMGESSHVPCGKTSD